MLFVCLLVEYIKLFQEQLLRFFIHMRARELVRVCVCRKSPIRLRMAVKQQRTNYIACILIIGQNATKTDDERERERKCPIGKYSKNNINDLKYNAVTRLDAIVRMLNRNYGQECTICPIPEFYSYDHRRPGRKTGPIDSCECDYGRKAH